eukprot:1322728-Amphidinium_carterae.1
MGAMKKNGGVVGCTRFVPCRLPVVKVEVCFRLLEQWPHHVWIERLTSPWVPAWRFTGLSQGIINHLWVLAGADLLLCVLGYCVSETSII